MYTECSDAIGYINAGGRGTRLNEIFVPDHDVGIAKALLSLGEPETRLVDHHIANLRGQGIAEIVIAAGDQHQVFEYINDTYLNDADVSVTKSNRQLGTGGDLAVYVALAEICNRPIIVQNVDTILDIDLQAFLGSHLISGALASIALTRNAGVPNYRSYGVGRNDQILYSAEFCNKDGSAGVTNDPVEYRASSSGAVAISPDFISESEWCLQGGQLSLYNDFLKKAWQEDGLYSYDNGNGFFRDVGTVATWLDSQNDPEINAHLCHADEGIYVKLREQATAA